MQTQSKPKLIAIFTLGLALILAACGDNTATSTLVPLPTTSGAGAGAATTTTSGGGAGAATTTSGAGNGAATTTSASGSGAQLVAINIPTITGTTEVPINAADFANVGGVPGRGGAAPTNGVTPIVKIFSSDDLTTTLTTNVQAALTGAGYTRANLGGGGGRGANGDTPGANPPAGFTPPANFTPGAGGRGFGGGQGGFGIYQKDGAADIVYNITQVPADATAMSSNRLFASLSPDVVQKFFDQVKGKKTLLIITAAPGLAQGFGNRGGGQGAGNGGGAVTPTPTN